MLASAAESAWASASGLASALGAPPLACLLGLLTVLTAPLCAGALWAADAPAVRGAAGHPALESLRRLGVSVVIEPACGGPGQLATYNMGLNRLCLSSALDAALDPDPNQRGAHLDRVLHHELVHVVQDCLDGLATPTSSTLAQGLRASGAFSDQQLAGFFLQYLRAQGNLRHVVATTAALPLDSRQREIEAYALQGDPALVRRLLATSCQPLTP